MTTPRRDMRVTIIERVPSASGREARGGRAFAWLGALLFVASLAYFLFTYAFTFGEKQKATAVESAIAWDFGLFTVFALHHSLFARERVRAVVARTVPASLERSVYVWTASVLFIAVCALWRPVGGAVWSIEGSAAWLVYAVMAAGVWLSVLSARVIDVFELAGVRPPQPAEFKVAGPYRIVRHPIYLGWFLMVLGVPVMTGTRLVFAVISCAYLLVAIPFEERTLTRTTAGRYNDYVRLVRWKLIPGIY